MLVMNQLLGKEFSQIPVSYMYLEICENGAVVTMEPGVFKCSLQTQSVGPESCDGSQRVASC